MVRGRRTRATANNNLVSTSVANSVGAVTTLSRTLNGNVDSGSTNLLADDQYYASPKRKECKIENVTTTTNMKCYGTNTNSISTTSINSHIKTRSSQQKTIQKYFKSSNKCKEFIQPDIHNIEQEIYLNLIDDDDDNDDNNKDLNILGACVKCSSGTSISEDDDDDTCEVDYCTDDDDDDDYNVGNGSHQQQQSQLCGFKTTSINNNLFLQEPVLSLNIDKSLNQPSSIIINKTLEVDPIFSITGNCGGGSGNNNTIVNGCNIVGGSGYQMNLNGQFNKIVSLNGSPKRSGSSDIESGNGSSSSSSTSSLSIINNYTINNSMILNMDSNSSDSGVIIDNNNYKIELSPNKRRKPTTPHRILCPSPVKHPLVHKSPTINGDLFNGNNNMNGRSPGLTKAALKNYTNDTITTTACYLNGAQRRHPKSRRRLNPTHSENNGSIISTSTKSSSPSSPQLVGGVRLTNETLKKLIKNKNNTALNQKTVLNSAKNPTAEQNTNNNVKLNHRISGHNINIQHNGQLTNSTTNNTTTSTDIKDSVNKIENNLISIIDKQMKPPTINHRQKTTQQTKNVNNNTIINDFFPVRRSVRKTKSAVKEEMMKCLEKAILEEQEDGLKIEEFEGKGRGIVADRHFVRSEFVVEYVGDLINMTEANQREKKYSLDENAGCYMYYFKHKNQQYCIDATAETGKLGRLVNHSRNGNLMTKVVVVKSRPHLVLIAKDDIQPGEELTYDYGDRSKEALLHHPWLAL